MSKTLICSQCGFVGSPKSGTKGSLMVEIVLWCFLLLPGFIYSIWRSSSRHSMCPKCKNSNLIPIDAPRARKIMEESMTKEEIEVVMENEQKRITNEKKRTTTMIIVVVIIFIVLIALIGTI